MPDYFWAALWGALAANAITVLVIILAVAYKRGNSVLQTGASVFVSLTGLGWRLVQIYVGLLLLFLGFVAARALLFG